MYTTSTFEGRKKEKKAFYLYVRVLPTIANFTHLIAYFSMNLRLIMTNFSPAEMYQFMFRM